MLNSAYNAENNENINNELDDQNHNLLDDQNDIQEGSSSSSVDGLFENVSIQEMLLQPVQANMPTITIIQEEFENLMKKLKEKSKSTFLIFLTFLKFNNFL